MDGDSTSRGRHGRTYPATAVPAWSSPRTMAHARSSRAESPGLRARPSSGGRRCDVVQATWGVAHRDSHGHRFVGVGQLFAEAVSAAFWSASARARRASSSACCRPPRAPRAPGNASRPPRGSSALVRRDVRTGRVQALADHLGGFVRRSPGRHDSNAAAVTPSHPSPRSQPATTSLTKCTPQRHFGTDDGGHHPQGQPGLPPEHQPAGRDGSDGTHRPGVQDRADHTQRPDRSGCSQRPAVQVMGGALVEVQRPPSVRGRVREHGRRHGSQEGAGTDQCQPGHQASARGTGSPSCAWPPRTAPAASWAASRRTACVPPRPRPACRARSGSSSASTRSSASSVRRTPPCGRSASPPCAASGSPRLLLLILSSNAQAARTAGRTSRSYAVKKSSSAVPICPT